MINKRAFTLIELLTVVGIVMILAGLLLAVVAKAKGKAKEISCINVIRQIGIGMAMYTGDHNYFPGKYSKGKQWEEGLAPYVLDPVPNGSYIGNTFYDGNLRYTFRQKLFCPNNPVMANNKNLMRADPSYGMNNNIIKGTNPLTVYAVVNPSLTVVMADSLNNTINLHSEVPVISTETGAEVDFNPRHDGKTFITVQDGMEPFVPDGGASLLFADGHAEVFAPGTLFSTNTAKFKWHHKE